jgi:hypothetical protein
MIDTFRWLCYRLDELHNHEELDMPPISNADKQDRFRRKELLTRHAERIFRMWEGSAQSFREVRTPQDVRHMLEKAVEIPSGWTEDDYRAAERKLGQCHLDLISAVDQIANDVNGDWETSSAEFMTTPDPAKLIADHKANVEKARTLASHLISALKLSNCSDGDQAAALMEALRFVGRSVAGNRDIRRSEATAICLASIGPQYDRPEWFAEQLSHTIRKQIDKNIAHEVGRHLQS